MEGRSSQTADTIASRGGLIKKFSSKNEVRAKAVEFLKQ